MTEQSTVKNEPKPVNAAVKVSISPDGLEARLLIEPPKFQGAEVTAQGIDSAIIAAGVTFGVNMMVLNNLRKEPKYSAEFLIAQGVAPVNGLDGSIHFKFDLGADTKPKVRQDGTVDYRDLGIVRNVKKGQLLAEITLPTSGKDGKQVTGKKIAAAMGKSVPYPVGRNTELSSDGTKLTASIDGHVSLEGARVHVLDTFIIAEDVDTSTGNIRSFANVTVCSNVLEGYMIDADGNVDVGGTVEGGSVKAGKNINIRRGVVGRGISKIDCKGDFTSTFLENCEVNVAGSLKAESIMNCNIKCGGKLELIGLRAKLMGGRFVVGEDIVANAIGSPAMLHTELVLGTDPSVMTRYSALAGEIKQLQENVEKLNQIVDLLGRYEQAGTLPASKKQMLVKSKISLMASKDKLQKDQEEYATLAAQVQNSGKGKVICRGVMYRGVKLTIGFASMELVNDITASTFALVDGKIAITPSSSY